MLLLSFTDIFELKWLSVSDRYIDNKGEKGEKSNCMLPHFLGELCCFRGTLSFFRLYLCSILANLLIKYRNSVSHIKLSGEETPDGDSKHL